MRALRASALLSAVTLAGALVTLPAAAAAPSSALLRYHFVAKHTAAYQLALSLSGSIPVMAPKLTAGEKVPFTQKVLSVYPDGSGQVSYSFTSATSTLNGKTTTSALAAGSIERISPMGRATVIKAVGLENQFGGMLNIDPTLGSPIFPPKPVAVGGKWTAKQQVSLGSIGSLVGTLHYTLVSLTTQKGHTIATIGATGSIPLNLAGNMAQAMGTSSVDETVTFDVTAGAVTGLNATIKVSANLGGGLGGQSTGRTAQSAALTLKLNLTRQ